MGKSQGPDSLALMATRLALATLAPFALALALPLAAMAHHGTTQFDRTNPIVVSGVVREFRWTSPHAWILLDVPATAMPTTPADLWSFEGASISVMVRNGWKSGSLRPGDRVTVLAAPRRDGARGGEFLSVTMSESGKVLQVSGQ